MLFEVPALRFGNFRIAEVQYLGVGSSREACFRSASVTCVAVEIQRLQLGQPLEVLQAAVGDFGA